VTLPASCFYWERHSGRGTVRHDGVEIELRAMPHIAGLPAHVVEIDFVAGNRRGELRISAAGRREMTRDECAAVQIWLQRMSTDARQLV